MGKEEVMVVRTSTLLEEDEFIGFMPHTKIAFLNKINNNYEFRPRDEVEEDLIFKQPIAYGVLINTKTKKIFAVQRHTNDNYGEKRLKGKWNWGIGGHIDPEDADSKDPIYSAMLREVEEEINIDSGVYPHLTGYVNLKGGVHDVHFGVVYILETEGENVSFEDGAHKAGAWKTLDELKKMAWELDVEEWSIACLEPLEEYFEKLK